jgi:hypothetical protein
MWMSRTVCLVLVVALLNLSVVSAGVAAGVPLSPEEASDLSARQATSPELAEFRGGDAGAVILVLAVVGIIVYLVYQHASTHASAS